MEISSGQAVSLQSGHQPRFLTGLDAGKSSTPGIGDTYYATDKGKVYVCLAAGTWQSESPMPFQIPLRMAWLAATNMPLAGDELFPLYPPRVKVDLSKMHLIRMQMNVIAAGTASAIARVRYSTDNITFLSIVATGNLQVSLAAVGHQNTAWQEIATGAKADVYLQLWGEGGDGVADPAMTSMLVQVK